MKTRGGAEEKRSAAWIYLEHEILGISSTKPLGTRSLPFDQQDSLQVFRTLPVGFSNNVQELPLPLNPNNMTGSENSTTQSQAGTILPGTTSIASDGSGDLTTSTKAADSTQQPSEMSALLGQWQLGPSVTSPQSVVTAPSASSTPSAGEGVRQGVSAIFPPETQPWGIEWSLKGLTKLTSTTEEDALARISLRLIRAHHLASGSGLIKLTPSVALISLRWDNMDRALKLLQATVNECYYLLKNESGHLDYLSDYQRDRLKYHVAQECRSVILRSGATGMEGKGSSAARSPLRSSPSKPSYGPSVGHTSGIEPFTQPDASMLSQDILSAGPRTFVTETLMDPVLPSQNPWGVDTVTAGPLFGTHGIERSFLMPQIRLEGPRTSRY